MCTSGSILGKKLKNENEKKNNTTTSWGFLKFPLFLIPSSKNMSVSVWQ
jgi:hypothetical protein